MDKTDAQAKLGDLPIGSRLMFRSKKDWRTAVVARISDEHITISVASPTGYNYRLRRAPGDPVATEGRIQYLVNKECSDTWRENLSHYDKRW